MDALAPHAQAHATHVNDIFVAAPKPPGKVTIREFAKFFNILQCFDEDSDHITNNGSSGAMKASDLVVLFYITAALFTLQQLTFRIQAVSN